MSQRPSGPPTILDRPFVSFGRETCGELGAALRREWLITNGLGGYAMGSLAGIPTRAYHAWLVAALRPPVGRTVLVGGLGETLVGPDGTSLPLSAFEWRDGTLAPDGWRHLEGFTLEGMLPVWCYAHAGLRVERRAWMIHGANTTVLRYTLLDGPAASLRVTPLLTRRDHHELPPGGGELGVIEERPGGLDFGYRDDGPTLRLRASDGWFGPSPGWWWGLRLREETARGLPDSTDLYAPGTFELPLAPGRSVDLVLSLEEPPSDPGATLAEARARQLQLLARAEALGAEAPVQQLVLAADQFLVARELPDGTRIPTVIAGYPWFSDWGRDMFLALPGLTLATGRGEDAAAILRAWADQLQDGLIPNTFPESGEEPLTNTADATLWFVLALAAYVRETDDVALVVELLPALKAIVAAHVHGTRHGIGLDPADGLLRHGGRDEQLTWMDARVDGHPVTPRSGKAVEIQALWYDTLCVVAAGCATSGDADADGYFAMADQAARSFRRRFGLPGGGLRDVVDGPDGDDDRLRPNQLLAISLPYPLLSDGDAAAALARIETGLATSLGLRTLAPGDRDYVGRYEGGPARRDAAYHQGPAWSWLLGPYLEARMRVDGGAEGARRRLAPIAHHLRDAGLGSVSELFDGDAPHTPRGAVAQAWGVAEVLRAWSLAAPWSRSRQRARDR